MSDVVRDVIPIGAAAERPAAIPAAPRHRPVVDEWGRDQATIDTLMPIARLRWNVDLSGLDHLPATGGALLVINDRQWSWNPVMAAAQISQRSARVVRFAGRSDRAPGGALLRRLGGILARPDEVATALAEGELVMIAAAIERRARQCGAVDHRLVAPAIVAGLAVLPVAAVSSSVARRARVQVGPALRRPAARRGPLAEVEVADAARGAVQRLLDQMGAVSAVDLLVGR